MYPKGRKNKFVFHLWHRYKYQDHLQISLLYPSWKNSHHRLLLLPTACPYLFPKTLLPSNLYPSLKEAKLATKNNIIEKPSQPHCSSPQTTFFFFWKIMHIPDWPPILEAHFLSHSIAPWPHKFINKTEGGWQTDVTIMHWNCRLLKRGSIMLLITQKKKCYILDSRTWEPT